MRASDLICHAAQVAEYGLTKVPFSMHPDDFSSAVEERHIGTMLDVVSQIDSDDVDCMVVAMRVRGTDGKLGQVQISCGGHPVQRAMLALALLGHVQDTTDPGYFDLDKMAAEREDSDDLNSSMKNATDWDLSDLAPAFEIDTYEGDYEDVNTSLGEERPKLYIVK